RDWSSDVCSSDLAGQRGGGAVQAEVPEAHFFEELEPRADLRKDVAGDPGLAAGQAEPAEQAACVLDGQGGVSGDVPILQPYRKRLGPPAPAVAARAGARFVVAILQPGFLLAGLVFTETGQRHSGAEAALAPAVPRVVRKQPRVELGEAAAAAGAGAFGGEDGLAAADRDLHGAAAEIQRALDQLIQLCLASGPHLEGADRQVDIV